MQPMKVVVPAVRAALSRLSQEGFAVARMCVTTPNRVFEYKLPGAIE